MVVYQKILSVPILTQLFGYSTYKFKLQLGSSNREGCRATQSALSVQEAWLLV